MKTVCKRSILSYAFAVISVLPVLFGQACGSFSGLSSNMRNLSSSNLFSCTYGSTYQNGVCTAPTTSSTSSNSVSLAGANQTTVPFGSGFQKFVYSAAFPGQVNFTGLSGKVALDSNSPFFSEALFTIGYSPSGQCPANGTSYMEYNDVFNAMPGAQILQQYILKLTGGRLELPTEYNLNAPVPVQGCAFIILDGDAGAKGSVDTMTSQVSFNFNTAAQNGANYLKDAAGGEYCYGLSTGCTSSSTNQFRTVSSSFGSAGHISQLTGSISAAPLYIYKSTSLPQGSWTAHNYFYIDRGCSAGGSGVQTNQDFFSQIPSGAVALLDTTQNGSNGNIAQQSYAQAEDVEVNAGDCIIQLLQVGGAGPIDIEVQIKANVGASTANATASDPSTSSEVPSANIVSISNETAVYRLTNHAGGNFYTINTDAIIPDGYSLAKADPVFMVINTPVANSVLLQRCYQGSVYFLSTDPNCEGSRVSPNGPIGYILTQSASGAVPLYRNASADWSKVLETTDSTQFMATQEVLGYVGTTAGPVATTLNAVSTAVASSLASAQTSVVYRFLLPSGAHGYSLSSSGSEFKNASLEGTAFKVYSSNVSGTVGLYKCTYSNIAYLSVDSGCEGGTATATLGYLSTAQTSGLIPIYRFRRADWHYTLETVNTSEGQGYPTMEVMGFAPAN